MKRVILRSLLAGPAGVLQPGEHALDDALADSLVHAGFAHYCHAVEPKRVIVSVSERPVETEMHSLDEREKRTDTKPGKKHKGGKWA